MDKLFHTVLYGACYYLSMLAKGAASYFVLLALLYLPKPGPESLPFQFNLDMYASLIIQWYIKPITHILFSFLVTCGCCHIIIFISSVCPQIIFQEWLKSGKSHIGYGRNSPVWPGFRIKFVKQVMFKSCLTIFTLYIFHYKPPQCAKCHINFHIHKIHIRRFESLVYAWAKYAVSLHKMSGCCTHTTQIHFRQEEFLENMII